MQLLYFYRCSHNGQGIYKKIDSLFCKNGIQLYFTWYKLYNKERTREKYRGKFMKQKQTMGIYTCIWIVAIVILIVSLFQNLGYAKVINYSGIVRGATDVYKRQMCLCCFFDFWLQCNEFCDFSIHIYWSFFFRTFRGWNCYECCYCNTLFN